MGRLAGAMRRLSQVFTPRCLDSLRVLACGDRCVGLLSLGHFQELDCFTEVQRCQVKLPQAQVKNAKVVEVVLRVHLPALGVEQIRGRFVALHVEARAVGTSTYAVLLLRRSVQALSGLVVEVLGVFKDRLRVAVQSGVLLSGQFLDLNW